MSSFASAAKIENKAVTWWWFLLHQFLSTIGVSVLAAFLVSVITGPSRARWILTETPYFPIQITLAFLFGFALRRYRRHRAMEWVWVIPLLILCVCLAITPLPFVVRFQRYFGWACRPESRCFVQLAVTLPFYTAASYSLAAFLSGHSSRSSINR